MSSFDAKSLYAIALCDALLAGDSNLNALLKRGRELIGHEPDWLVALCVNFVSRAKTTDSRQLSRVLLRSESFQHYWRNLNEKPPVVLRHFPVYQSYRREPYISQKALVLNTTQDLCQLLGIDESRLFWLSGGYTKHSNPPKAFCHYHYQWISKNTESRQRLLEVPKSQLKRAQTVIHRHLLSHVSVHPCCHGFVPGRSIVTFTQAHVGKRWILKMDLKNFFSYVTYPRVFHLFSAFGYPQHIVRALSRLTTHALCVSQCDNQHLDFQHSKLLQVPHLAQGAPTSPVLANSAAYTLDCRLQALAQAHGMNYSRYADDLLFSSDEQRSPRRFIPFIAKIAQEENFAVNFHKCRVISQAQRQTATGIVLNQKANVTRQEYQRIKAILHNCARFGSESQQGQQPDFHAYLRGKIAFISSINPTKGEKLKQLYQRIK